jgi:serine/threonine protein kinase
VDTVLATDKFLFAKFNTYIKKKSQNIRHQKKIMSEELEIKKIYKFSEVIGAGSYGKVRRARNRDTGFQVAVKILKK